MVDSINLIYNNETFFAVDYLLEYISYRYFTDVNCAYMHNYYYNQNEFLRTFHEALMFSYLYIDIFEIQKLNLVEVQNLLKNRYLNLIKQENYDVLLRRHILDVILPFNKNFNDLVIRNNLITPYQWHNWMKAQKFFVYYLDNSWYLAKKIYFSLNRKDFERSFDENFLEYIIINNFLTYLEFFVVKKPCYSLFEKVFFYESLWVEFEYQYKLECKKEKFLDVEAYLRFYLNIGITTFFDDVLPDKKQFLRNEVYCIDDILGNLKFKRKLLQIWKPKNYYFW